MGADTIEIEIQGTVSFSSKACLQRRQQLSTISLLLCRELLFKAIENYYLKFPSLLMWRDEELA